MLAEHETNEGLALARSAANREDETESTRGDAGAIPQARELLLDILLEMLSPGEALADYELALTALGHVPSAEFAAWEELAPSQSCQQITH